ncbi:hypothetical protein [Chryseobacterium sp. PCH239]|uniref:hypothetical protein n=1 Tax=Chryseobacterium sp. PCH239 TaxID=2825845 RepID=UPI00209DF407|nr:hypothetical protein [Chryseobacterium sp. PCH239]
MNTKRLSTNMEKALSDQMNKEIHASHVFYPTEFGLMIKVIRELPTFFTAMLRKKEITRSNSWNIF